MQIKKRENEMDRRDCWLNRWRMIHVTPLTTIINDLYRGGLGRRRGWVERPSEQRHRARLTRDVTTVWTALIESRVSFAGTSFKDHSMCLKVTRLARAYMISLPMISYVDIFSSFASNSVERKIVLPWSDFAY